MKIIKDWINEKIIPNFFHLTLSKLKKFKNIHKGEICYLIGDGCSIKYFDLRLFSNHIAIPCAMLPFHIDFKKLNVPFAFIIEDKYFYPYNKFTNPPFNWMPNVIQREYHKIIKNNDQINFFLSITNLPTVWEKNVTFIHKNWVDSDLSKDHIGRNNQRLFGSINAALYLAIYFGFTKIYLVGFDYTHAPSRILHWYEKGEGWTQDMPEYNKEYLKLASNFADITTVTLNSKAHNIPYIDYKDLTGEDALYRENRDILTSENMKILSTWPEYRIY